ncbi:S8 family serine peptidase [Halapricum hydrolyticum]|uniref:S8 family serine peptidase n=1 Tax=Halapricum hydrolyticum TaxID=2979991 RepID=A0AAE3I9X3_9EURY|nr:S8 family serine peptidase [Halapricum hydrolyticum]MCU4716641.1 S8 family serine peptidase [Halapricum hydrolyticum]MCU4725754.1 S8 family serine peptidase [Halapricum hydrolyticum]
MHHDGNSEHEDAGISRREVLRESIAAGAGAFALGAGVGSASASPDGEYNVGTESPAAEEATERAAENVQRVFDWGDGQRTFTGRFSEKAAENLAKRPDVRYVEENGEMHALGQTLSWGINRVDADVLHDNGETGNGADVAIIDTGIDDDHPDLEANVGAGKAFVDCKGPNCNYSWSDDDDHGTHCAGIADAVNNSEGVVGVSMEATLHAVKVLDKNGSGSFSDVAAGIEYVADQGWDVGSMSLGASSGSQTVKDACQYAYGKGVLLVGSAGNDGPCSDCVGYPAAYEEVVAVSSTDQDDSLSNFSSTGPEVELAAPGGSIYSTVIGGYDTFSGTSMSCPHVSGAGGQLMANGYTNTEARQRLQDTAEDLGLSVSEQGAGLLDAEAAVLDGGSDSTPSVSWVDPNDGETVSGTMTVRIDASDSEDSDDSLDVTYTVDGGSERSTSYNSTSGYYEDDWDTTGVGDGDHTLEATATDSAGNTSRSSITVTTDNTESAPTVDSLSASEVETSDSDAEFDVDWGVSDDDGNLDTVDLTLTDDTDGETEDTATIDVSGDSASGTNRLVAAGDDGSGNDYTVAATVTDSNGNTGSDTTAVSETENTDSGPVIDQFDLTDDSNPAWTRYGVDWAVSDDDGDLSGVTSEMLDSSGNVLDSDSSSVSGSSASGTHSVRSKGSASDIRLTVTDEAGNSTSDPRSI